MKRGDPGSYSSRAHIRGRFPGFVLCGRTALGLTIVTEARQGDGGLCRICCHKALRISQPSRAAQAAR